MNHNNAIRIGVIGAGRIGKIHAENLATRIPDVRLVAIADPIHQAARQLADRLHLSQAYADHHTILDDPQVDAVAICSSTDTHADIICEAAAAGKYIFCEKPIAYDLTKIDEALSAVEKAGVKLQIGFNRRFDPNFSKIHEMVANGKIGEPHILRITSRDPAPPPIEYIKRSGGIFFDMTIHDFDMARYLIGSEVDDIFSTGTVRVDPEIGQAGDIDTTVVTLRFKNGAIGTIDNSRKAVYGYDQRVEVFGSAGMVAAMNNTPDSCIYSNSEGVVSAKPLYFFLERYTESFIIEMKAFVNCILNNTQPLVTGVDGRIAVLMSMAANKSFRENRPIKLIE